MEDFSSSKEKVFSSLLDNKITVIQNIMDMQEKSVIISRNFYHFFYFLFLKKNNSEILSLKALYTDVIIENVDLIESIDPLAIQIFINCLKTLYSQPDIFVQALVKLKVPKKEFNLMSYTTFPAFFCYFTSKEDVDAASNFIISMIKSNAPRYMLKHMAYSLLLSSHVFIDAFWCNFAKNINKRCFPYSSCINTTLTKSIKDCGKLIPQSILEVLRELSKKHPNVVYSILIRKFLPTTFKLWSNISPISFYVPIIDEINEFFESNRGFKSKVGLALISTFLDCKQEIRTCPSYFHTKSVPNQTIIFSKRDIWCFCYLFKNISNKIPMFAELENSAAQYSKNNFEAFSISYFCKRSDESPQKSGIFDISTKSDFVSNVFMEEALHRYKELLSKGVSTSVVPLFSSEEFIDYKRKKEEYEFVQIINDQEEIIFLYQLLKEINDHQNSLLNQHRYVLSLFTKQVSKIAVKNKKLDMIMLDKVWKEVTYRRSTLKLEAIYEVLNLIKLDRIKVSSKLLTRTLKTIGQTEYDMDINIIKLETIANLSSMLTNRKEFEPGRFFIAMQFIIETAKEVANYWNAHNSSKLVPIMIIKAILKMSNCTRNITYFLFFEKVVFRSPLIIHIPVRYAKNFNTFFQAMWQLIESDQSLLQEIISLDLDPNFK